MRCSRRWSEDGNATRLLQPLLGAPHAGAHEQVASLVPGAPTLVVNLTN